MKEERILNTDEGLFLLGFTEHELTVYKQQTDVHDRPFWTFAYRGKLDSDYKTGTHNDFFLSWIITELLKGKEVNAA